MSIKNPLVNYCNSKNALAERMNRTLKEEFGLGRDTSLKKLSRIVSKRCSEFVQ